MAEKETSGMDIETLVFKVGGVFLLILVVAVLGFMFRAGRSSSGGAIVAHAWMADIKGERYDAAYEKLAEAYRRDVGPKTFREALSRNNFLRGMQSFESLETEAGSDRVRIRGELESIAGPVEATFHLIRESNGNEAVWRISGVVLSGQPALPLPTAGTSP